MSLLVGPSAWAQFTFEQKSEPAGIFATGTQTYESNASVNSRAISLLSGTYAFTHWELNGVRMEETNGSSLTNFSFLINSDCVAVAHYLDLDNDLDNDGVPDWYELRHLGSLENNQSYDFDQDGISLFQEYRFDLSPTTADLPRPGGISRRRSQTSFVNLGGARKLTLSSDPPGLVASGISYPEVNSTFTSASLSGANSGYYFSHWEINGVRAADDVGIGLSQVIEVMDSDKQIVAKYFDQNLDEDADGMPDWYEWHTFGTLGNGNLSDSDNDSIPLSTERKFGLNGAIKDLFQLGGISRRRSASITVNLGGATRVRLYSNPSGLIPTETLYLENNSTYSTNTLAGLTHGYHFSHWEINGQRVADASGIGLGAASTVLNESKEIVAKFFDQYEDQDADKIPDWFEWQQFGSLSFSEHSDPDEDGISVAMERKFGLSSVIVDNFSSGGVSRRRSGETGFIFDPNGVSDSDGDGLSNDLESTIGSDPNLVDTDGDGYSDFDEYGAGTDPASASSMPNQAPANLLASSNLFLYENRPVGTIVGEFNATDPDGDTLSYSLVSGTGENNNSLFSMEINGTLRSRVVFDYETNASSYSIRVRARDFHHQAIEGNFTIYLLDVDDTPPIITLHGDTNATHEAGTIYLDANASWSDAVDGTGIILADGEVNAGIPGVYELSYNYSDVAGNAAQSVTRTINVVDTTAPIISLHGDANITHEAGNPYIDANASWSDAVDGTGEILASGEVNTTEPGVYLLSYNYTDSAGNSAQAVTREIEVINLAPDGLSALSDLNLTVFENAVIGTEVATFVGTDPNPDHIFSYSMVPVLDENSTGLLSPEFFELDENGTLFTLRSLDYEVDPQEIFILVRVTDQHGAYYEQSFVVSIVNVVEDFDQDGEEDHFDSDDDNDGFDDSLELLFGFNPLDRWDYPEIPIVRTLEVSEENGTLIFGAKILSSGGFENLDVGVSIFDESGILMHELLQNWNMANGTDVFFNYEFALQPGGKIHYQAFAQNNTGNTTGQMMEYWIGQDSSLGKWWGSDTQLEGGWRESSWLGIYLPNLNNEWVYHLKLGWIFVQPDSHGSYWLWMPGEEWLWTKQGVWPYLWSNLSADWLYLLYSSDSHFFYDYSEGMIRK